ncbi:MFS transporter [Carboxylicivirga sp. M1479]|uniref:MFS transporter n=1 Tax=Carboxylicivirga sp. M1479 TaxID=2594476 RepID=UPI00117766E3|nr:MFS transporter [Carboxylicivirga sp. M1479]TRX70628.1 MFS transporter [Carboxylicivirga sp. M1479]
MTKSTDVKTKYRYRILLMLVFATTINYFDRSIIGVMAPILEDVFGWTNTDYATIVIAFKVAYGIGMLTMGGIIDRLGTKKGYMLAIGIWSLFGMGHALVVQEITLFNMTITSVGLFAVARFGLGFGEAGHFPAANKTVAEYFPKKERAFATGLYNAATSIGAIAAPFVVGAIVDKHTGEGWKIPFLITGALSSIWVVLWLKVYKKPADNPNISKEELAYINSDEVVTESTEKISWGKVLPKRQTWAFAVAKISDAVWFFYLFWGAKYMASTFGIDIKSMGLPFLIIYALADGGSIMGGWISGYFMNKGWSVNKARKRTMLACALIILPVSYVAFADSLYVAVVLIGIGAAGHQAWMANIFTIVSDIFPKKAVASVTGIGGMVGVAAAALADVALGTVLDSAGNTGYFWAFLIGGAMYLVLLGIVQLLVPKMTPLDENLNLIKE